MKTKFAPKLKTGKRRNRNSALHPKVNAIVEQTAKHFHCSKSFVITAALAQFFKIKDEGSYDE